MSKRVCVEGPFRFSYVLIIGLQVVRRRPPKNKKLRFIAANLGKSFSYIGIEEQMRDTKGRNGIDHRRGKKGGMRGRLAVCVCVLYSYSDIGCCCSLDALVYKERERERGKKLKERKPDK